MERAEGRALCCRRGRPSSHEEGPFCPLPHTACRIGRPPTTDEEGSFCPLPHTACRAARPPTTDEEGSFCPLPHTACRVGRPPTTDEEGPFCPLPHTACRAARPPTTDEEGPFCPLPHTACRISRPPTTDGLQDLIAALPPPLPLPLRTSLVQCAQPASWWQGCASPWVSTCTHTPCSTYFSSRHEGRGVLGGGGGRAKGSINMVNMLPVFQRRHRKHQQCNAYQ